MADQASQALNSLGKKKGERCEEAGCLLKRLAYFSDETEAVDQRAP